MPPPTDRFTEVELSRLPEDLRELWDERAAIREFDGHQAREQAETHALYDLLRLARDDPRVPEAQRSRYAAWVGLG